MCFKRNTQATVFFQADKWKKRNVKDCSTAASFILQYVKPTSCHYFRSPRTIKWRSFKNAAFSSLSLSYVIITWALDFQNCHIHVWPQGSQSPSNCCSSRQTFIYDSKAPCSAISSHEKKAEWEKNWIPARSQWFITCYVGYFWRCVF